ncbi:MAG: aromatic ring-hydroxylating dioxygenase subunit alpha [Solirubrobacterales bacterium]
MSRANGQLPLQAAEIERTLRPLRSASGLPAAAFTDPAVLEWEIGSIFAGWVCLGHVSAVAEPGAYLAREFGAESIFAVGGEYGDVRAFYNVCRHRGSRLLEGAGKAGRLIRCPYHAWAYGFDGALLAAPHTEGLEDFDPACNALRKVRTALVGGLLLADPSGEAPDPAVHVGDLAERLERYRVSELRPAAERLYEVGANWKAVVENYNECLHCPGVHPELNALSPYDSGEAFEGAGQWCGGSLDLIEGAETMARNGGGERAPIAGLSGAELRSVLYVTLFPNALVSFHPDYVMLHTLWPLAPDRTLVTCEWLFEPATIAAEGFDPSDAVDFWDQVNREDWHVCELTQKGVASRGYSPGRYAIDEDDTHAFDRMVAERYMAALAGPA